MHAAAILGIPDWESPVICQGCEVFAVDEFHRKKKPPVALANVVHSANVGM
jgi:hypothetical protein